MNWLSILIAVLIFVGPAIGGVLKKIDEQRKLKAIQAERERRRIEMLRTGRAEEPIAMIYLYPVYPGNKHITGHAVWIR